MSDRYIPKLESLADAAKALPDPETWRESTYSVPLNDERLIKFKRIRFKDRNGRVVNKWVHEGKVRVN
jgi:hypothetical protein